MNNSDTRRSTNFGIFSAFQIREETLKSQNSNQKCLDNMQNCIKTLNNTAIALRYFPSTGQKIYIARTHTKSLPKRNSLLTRKFRWRLSRKNSSRLALELGVLGSTKYECQTDQLHFRTCSSRKGRVGISS